MSPKPLQPNQKFKPWPFKTEKGNGKRAVDREKLREQYINNPHHDWYAFCRMYGYNDSPKLSRHFPIRRWRDDWIDNQIGVQDEEAKVRAIAVRADVIYRRLDFVTSWGHQAGKFRELLEFAINRHQLLANLEHKLIVEAGGDAKKTKEVLDMEITECGSIELNRLLDAAGKLQIIEMRSLLLNTKDSEQMQAAILPPEKKTEGTDQTPEELPVQIMGEGGTLSPAVKITDIERIMSGWYDQMGGEKPLEKAQKITEATLVEDDEEEDE